MTTIISQPFLRLLPHPARARLKRNICPKRNVTRLPPSCEDLLRRSNALTLPRDGVGPAYPALPLLVNITSFFDRRSRANESTDPWTSTFASHPVSCSRGHSTMAINAWSAGFGAAARVRHPVTEEGGKFRATPWRRRRRACWKRSCSDHVRGGLK